MARSRYCVLVCCSMGLLLLLVNSNFIFLRETDPFVSQPAASSTNNNTFPLNMARHMLNVDSEKRELSGFNDTNERASTSSTPVSLNWSRDSDTPASPNVHVLEVTEFAKSEIANSSIRHETMSERSECEAAFARSQWLLWNLIDLALSSMCPFAIIFVLNISIILRISTNSRLAAARRGGGTHGLHDGSGVALNFDCDSQRVQILRPPNDLVNQTEKTLVTRDSNSKAERSVTLMLLVTTFAFVLMRTPIAVGHSLQMLLTEEKLFALIEPVTCMGALKTLPERMNHHMHGSRVGFIRAS